MYCEPSKKMGIIYVHIGTPKTGTTSIQMYLRNHHLKLEKYGVYYPEQAIEAMNYLGFSLLDKTPRLVRQLPLSAKELYENIKFSEGINIISAESFYTCSTAKFSIDDYPNRLKGHLPHEYEHKIIIYVRDYYKFISSLYQQYVKLHFHTQFCSDTFSEFVRKNTTYLEYYKNIEKWANAFGSDNIIVKNFDDYTDIVEAFMEELSIPYEKSTSTRENISHSHDKVEFKRLINTLNLPDDDKLKTIPNLLSQVELNEDNYSWFSPEDITFINNYVVDDNKNLLSKYGVSLPIVDEIPGTTYRAISITNLFLIANHIRDSNPKMYLTIRKSLKEKSCHKILNYKFILAFRCSLMTKAIANFINFKLDIG